MNRECPHCYEDVDPTKESYIHSPKSGVYRHLDCYMGNVTYHMKDAVRDILRKEDKFRKKLKKGLENKKRLEIAKSKVTH